MCHSQISGAEYIPLRLINGANCQRGRYHNTIRDTFRPRLLRSEHFTCHSGRQASFIDSQLIPRRKLAVLAIKKRPAPLAYEDVHGFTQSETLFMSRKQKQNGQRQESGEVGAGGSEPPKVSHSHRMAIQPVGINVVCKMCPGFPQNQHGSRYNGHQCGGGNPVTAHYLLYVCHRPFVGLLNSHRKLAHKGRHLPRC